MGFTTRRSSLTAGLAVLVAAGALGTGIALAAGTHQAMSSRPTIGLKKTSLGSVLDAGPKKLTVYMFTKDHGTKSSCDTVAACASIWPPVKTSGKPKAGPGVSASALGAAKEGKFMQATYHHHLLYYFKSDKTMSSVAGQGIQNAWYALSAKGAKVTKKPSSTTTTSTTPSTTGTSTTGGGGWG